MSELSEVDKAVKQFWAVLESKSGVTVPVHVKNILRYSNIDNIFRRQTFDEGTFPTLEKFVGEDMVDFLDPGADIKENFGIYEKNPSKFKFVPGTR